MRTYVMVTGILFALLTAAHIVRMFMEPSSIKDPIFIVFTVLAVGMTVWSWVVLRQARVTAQP
jgi:hypothetical protein